ncbi:hypothetical protein IE53DRAFT_112483 [Violaceomyces palustris]|uniref:Uncharacterized protein n=1 Tax=Violaceomyces palustris TaxID=1673888 RepID=A0ACD0P6J6_9BASI|nr:hypothetical protein IE53DRAFT_112483 [Violaceomyces palustris]
MSVPGPGHTYPPSEVSSQSTKTDPGILSYLIHTETSSVLDLRLQVSIAPDLTTDSLQRGSTSAASLDFRTGDKGAKVKEPLRPAYFKERTLEENDEIVDRLVDANSARVIWTIHRPSRGWYLHLKSPFLPQGSAVALRPAAVNDDDPTISPLTFSLRTSVNMSLLGRVQPNLGRSSLSGEQQGSGSEGGDFTLEAARSLSSTVSSRVGSRAASGSNLAKEKRVEGAGEVDSTEAEGHSTGRSQVHASTEAGAGHTRRRSVAGSGNYSTGMRKVSSKLSSNITIEVPEERAEGGGLLTASHPNRGPSADRPYSPVEPKNMSFGSPNPAASSRDATSDTSVRSKIDGRGSNTSNKLSMQCDFVLCDGLRPCSSFDSSSSGQVGFSGKQSWARRIWGMVPLAIRPPLAFDTSKNFSLRWMNAPGMSSSQNGHSSSGQGQGSVHSREGLEVLRFEDTSKWWLWDAKSSGKVVLQKSAIEALGLQKEFWIAITLAYLEFLEEKDGYEAAREG